MRHALSSRLAMIACVAALALAGCGRRGPLELPNEPSPGPGQATATQQGQPGAVSQEPPEPGLIQDPNQVYQVPVETKLRKAEAAQKRPINAPPQPKRSTFVLDPLL